MPSKKLLEVSGLCSLELIGDLIGHSGAVQVSYSHYTNKKSQGFKGQILIDCKYQGFILTGCGLSIP